MVMEEFVEKLDESVERNNREVVVLYLFPEFPETLENSRYFRLVEKGSPWQLRNGMHIYRNVTNTV